MKKERNTKKNWSKPTTSCFALTFKNTRGGRSGMEGRGRGGGGGGGCGETCGWVEVGGRVG